MATLSTGTQAYLGNQVNLSPEAFYEALWNKAFVTSHVKQGKVSSKSHDKLQLDTHFALQHFASGTTPIDFTTVTALQAPKLVEYFIEIARRIEGYGSSSGWTDLGFNATLDGRLKQVIPHAQKILNEVAKLSKEDAQKIMDIVTEALKPVSEVGYYNSKFTIPAAATKNFWGNAKRINGTSVDQSNLQYVQKAYNTFTDKTWQRDILAGKQYEAEYKLESVNAQLTTEKNNVGKWKNALQTLKDINAALETADASSFLAKFSILSSCFSNKGRITKNAAEITELQSNINTSEDNITKWNKEIADLEKKIDKERAKASAAEGATTTENVNDHLEDQSTAKIKQSFFNQLLTTKNQVSSQISLQQSGAIAANANVATNKKKRIIITNNSQGDALEIS